MLSQAPPSQLNEYGGCLAMLRLAHGSRSEGAIQSGGVADPTGAASRLDMAGPSDSQVNILLVDDQPANLLALEAVLAPLGQHLVRASSGAEALKRLEQDDFAVVLLDLGMPGLDGFETAKRIRARERSRHTPLIFLTGYADNGFPVAEAYRLGAVDYLVKPLIPDILRAKAAVFVELFRRAEQVRRLEQSELERRLTEQAERRFRAVIEHSWDAVALLGADGTIQYASPSTVRVLGYAPEEFVGRRFLDSLHPDDFARMAELFGQLLGESGRSLSAAFRNRHKDGSWRWLEGSGTNLLEEPSVRAIVANYHDVTERHEAEEAVRRSEERLRTLSDNLPRGAIYQAYHGPDDRTHFAYISGGVEQMFGVTPAEVVRDPSSLYGLIHEEELPRVHAAEEAALAGLAVFDCEFRQRTRWGEWRWVHCRSAPRRLGDGTVIWEGVVLDITDRKVAEEALKESDRRKDEFLAMLAHELRNPLAPILNGLHVLRLAGPANRAVERSCAMMERQVHHLTHLVDDLLDVSRITCGKVQLRCERLDLVRLVRTTAEDRRPSLEEAGLVLRLNVPETPLWVAGDATRLAQILLNLLDNAAKFTDQGKVITITVAAASQQVHLAVRDEGVGFTPELVPRLFSPFAQADNSLERRRGGLGLGLALVKGLTELHGGEVQARSDGPGCGAEFIVRLPRQEEPAALAVSPAAPQPAGPGLRVLVVEDHPDAAESLRLLLEILGHQVALARSGPEGVQAARTWQPDVVLCDIGLPGLDGYGVARALRQTSTTARLIAVTGYGKEEDRRRSREAGFDHHLVKPANPQELQRLLVSG
jgi:PAS domain S-box-containing protein